jgi:thiamine biosynthesis lipoprotein
VSGLAQEALRRTEVWMDTTVTVEAVGPGPGSAEEAIARAFGWFAAVEESCSRFDPGSELRRLCARPGEAVPVGQVLWSALELALAVAEESGGAFDPTVGAAVEARGFDRNYRTGRRERAGAGGEGATWRDVVLDAGRRTVLLRRPLLLDLGGIAKGLAIDLALCELRAFPGAAVDAGGDVAVRGRSPRGGPWRVGIRHPRRPGTLCATLQLDEGAVCTSGDYERRSGDGGHHVHPGSGRPVDQVASCTVVAPTAVLADALSTAACVLGPERGIAWLGRQGVEALVVGTDLGRRATPGWSALEVPS